MSHMRAMQMLLTFVTGDQKNLFYIIPVNVAYTL